MAAGRQRPLGYPKPGIGGCGVIRKYLTRYGRAPAESDIERHFLVSAPSVNQMMQMLERRGFITRQAGVPRSARICIDLDSQT